MLKFNCFFFIDKSLFIGLVTAQTVQKLLDDGDVVPHQVQKFYTAVKLFYSTAVSYALNYLSIKDPVLLNSKLVNFKDRTNATIQQVAYFMARCRAYMQFTIIPSLCHPLMKWMQACMHYLQWACRQNVSSFACVHILYYFYRFPNLLTCGTSPSELAQLEDQFLECQVMLDSEIPSPVWESAEDEEGHHWMDIIWGYMNNMKSPDGSSYFQKLAQVAITCSDSTTLKCSWRTCFQSR